MKRLIIFLAIFYSFSLRASLSIEIDPHTIQAGQSFRIILTDNIGLTGIPDLSSLQEDFVVLGTGHNRSYTSINGQTSVVSQWVISLMPKKAGKLLIPSIKLGKTSTIPQEIEVKNLKNETSGSQNLDSSKDQILEVESSILEPLINQQIIYTVKLFNSKPLMNATYQAPTLSNGFLIPLGVARHYQTTLNGRYYTVDELRYAIFPEKSGGLKITGPVLSALVDEDFPEPINLKAKTLKLKVKSAPVDLKNWFPAKAVTLREVYDNDSSELEIGKPLTRTIIVEAKGLPGQLIPVLTFKTEAGYSSYPDKTEEKSSLYHQDIVGSTVTKFSYVFDKPGDFILPGQNLPWYNTQSGKVEVATLPERIIHIKGGLAPAEQAESEENILVPKLTEFSRTNTLKLDWWLVVLLALACLLTCIAWWLKGKSFFARPSLKKIRKNLKQACQANHKELAKQNLISFAEFIWPEQHPMNLSKILSLSADKELSQAIEDLIQALYNKAYKSEWDGKKLWEAIRKFKSLENGTEEQSSLPPINPVL